MSDLDRIIKLAGLKEIKKVKPLTESINEDDEYPNEPDDGHEHEFVEEDGLPDTGTDATSVICTKCGLVSAIDDDENDIDESSTTDILTRGFKEIFEELTAEGDTVNHSEIANTSDNRRTYPNDAFTFKSGGSQKNRYVQAHHGDNPLMNAQQIDEVDFVDHTNSPRYDEFYKIALDLTPEEVANLMMHLWVSKQVPNPLVLTKWIEKLDNLKSLRDAVDTGTATHRISR